MPSFYSLFRSPLSVVAVASVLFLGGALTWKIVAGIGAKLQTSPSYVLADATSTTDGGADWQQEMILLGLATTSDPHATSDADPISMIGPVVVGKLLGQYAGLIDSDTYSEDAAAKAGESIAANVRAAISYKTYDRSQLSTDTNISYQRMLQYRADMRVALAPLLDNTEPELDIYGKYVETSDPSYLTKLVAAAKNYRLAAEQASKVVVPRDAVNYHTDILNALSQFAATLDAMASHGEDVYGSVALLRNYNTAEQKVFNAFDALSAYYGQKTP